MDSGSNMHKPRVTCTDPGSRARTQAKHEQLLPLGLLQVTEVLIGHVLQAPLVHLLGGQPLRHIQNGCREGEETHGGSAGHDLANRMLGGGGVWSRGYLQDYTLRS